MIPKKPEPPPNRIERVSKFERAVVVGAIFALPLVAAVLGFLLAARP